MDTSTPASKFFEGVCVAIFIYVLYEICMWYFRMQTSTSTSGSSCGCGKKKMEHSTSGSPKELAPSQKACIAVGLCNPASRTIEEINSWKKIIIEQADKVFPKKSSTRPASKSAPKSGRRK